MSIELCVAYDCARRLSLSLSRLVQGQDIIVLTMVLRRYHLMRFSKYLKVKTPRCRRFYIKTDANFLADHKVLES